MLAEPDGHHRGPLWSDEAPAEVPLAADDEVDGWAAPPAQGDPAPPAQGDPAPPAQGDPAPPAQGDPAPPAPDGPAQDEAAQDDFAPPAQDEPGGLGGTRRRKRRPLLTALVIVVVLFVIAAVVGYVHVSNDVNPSGRQGSPVTVTLPRGASTLQIADRLAHAGVIHGAYVFEAYLKIKGSGPLLAGTYTLPTNQSYAAVVNELEKGPVVVTYRLVVPEGFTLHQIAAAVGRLHDGITASAFLAAATGGQVRSQYEPAGSDSLEGLLFPATYPVPQGETADALVRWMVSTFEQEVSQLGLRAAAKSLHYSPYQVIKVASIVEREAKLEQDRGPIASVIYNRLARGMPIGAESTLLYGLGEPTRTVSITTPNPYNTLVNKGLPPTPISNPGVASLAAAISPPGTTYLYWVEVNPDGKMGFGTTPAQFKQLQRDCRVVHLC